MRKSCIFVVVGLVGCVAPDDQYHVEILSRNSCAIQACSELGGLPITYDSSIGLTLYQKFSYCDFTMVRERERREREGKIQPRIGTGTAERLTQ